MVGIKRQRLSLIEKLLYLYLALISIMRAPYLPIFGQKVQYADFVFIIIFVIWLQLLIKGKCFLKIDRFDLFPCMLSILFLFSALFSQNIFKSGIEYLGIFYLFCAYFLIKQLISNANLWWKALILWSICSAAVSLIGIIGYINAMVSGNHNTFVNTYEFVSSLGARINSTFTNPNMLASYLHVSIVFGVILLRRAQGLKQRTFWIYLLIVIYLITCLLAKSRNISGIFLTLSIILILPQRSKLLWSCRYIVHIISIFIILFAIITAIWWIFPIDTSIDNGLLNVKVNLIEFPYYIYSRAALAMAINNPFLGVGMGMYNSNLMKYIDINKIESSCHIAYPSYGIGKDPHIIWIKKTGMDPHSTYLGWAAETGLLILSLIIAMFFYYCRTMVLYFKRETNDFNKYLIWCFFAGLCGFLVNGFWIDILTMRHLWVFMSMGTALLSIITTVKEKGDEFVYSYPGV